MDERLEKDGEAGTEPGRSPSGVPPSGTPGEEPQGQSGDAEVPEEGSVSPAPPPSDGDEGGAAGALETEGLLDEEPAWRPPNLAARGRGQRVLKKKEDVSAPLSATKKILLLDLWTRSGLPAREFASLTGLSLVTMRD